MGSVMGVVCVFSSSILQCVSSHQMSPDMSATDGAGYTALHIAVKGGNADIVEELIKV